MLVKLLERLKAANAPRPAEESIFLRGATLAAVMVGAIALAVEGAVPARTAAAALALFPIGYYVSFRRRHRNNWQIKIVLAVAALIALWHFAASMQGVRSVDLARFALAELFLWIQVIHGFDVPSRRDLYFSIGASVGLIALAASVAQTTSFAPFLAAYGVCALTALAAAHRSEIMVRSVGAFATVDTDREPGRVGGRATVALIARHVRPLGTSLAALFVVGAAAALLLPRSTGSSSLSMPFNLGRGLLAPGDGSIFNPEFGDGGAGRESNGAYYGVDNRLDLSVRGSLGDDLVMRVRSSEAAMWKGAVFDTYDGTSWRISGPNSSLAGGPRYLVPETPLGPRRELIQTFFIESEQPNVIYAAEQPSQLYLPTGLRTDPNGTLRSTATLGPGSVYSVISYVPAAGSELRRPPSLTYPLEVVGRYLQLPPTLPDRVRRLARRLTASRKTEYGAVRSVIAYLRTHYRYTLDSAIPPPGRDAVDHFLFDERQGFCEQFASSAAVLLRSVGVPTRMVAGFTPGDYNFLSGYFDVHAEDAHAWIEVYFPDVGWYAFDPTSDVPQAQSEAARMFPGVSVVAQAVTAAVAATKRAIATPPARYLLAALAALALAYAATELRRRRRPTAAEVADLHPVIERFESMSASLAAVGLGRYPPETPSEYGERLGRLSFDLLPPKSLVERVIRTVEEASYSRALPSDLESEVALAAIDELEEALRR